MDNDELLQVIYQNILSMQTNMQSMQTDIQSMKTDIQSMKTDIKSMQKDIKNIDQRLSVVEVTLESEINRNIKIIAEGHLDLSRKLNEAIKISLDIQAKQEVQDIYIVSHENKLRALG